MSLHQDKGIQCLKSQQYILLWKWALGRKGTIIQKSVCRRDWTT